jgi:hypothetical protein
VDQDGNAAELGPAAASEAVLRELVGKGVTEIATVIGAFMGLRYFGLLGLLIGPLAISYFFELIRMYRVEYLDFKDVEVSAEQLAAVERRLTPTGTSSPGVSGERTARKA